MNFSVTVWVYISTALILHLKMKSLPLHAIRCLCAFLPVILTDIAISTASVAVAAVAVQEDGDALVGSSGGGGGDGNSVERVTIMMTDNAPLEVDVDTDSNALGYVDINPSIDVTTALALTSFKDMRFFFAQYRATSQGWPYGNFVSDYFTADEPLDLPVTQYPPVFPDAQRLYYYNGADDARTFVILFQSLDGATAELVRLRMPGRNDISVELKLAETHPHLANSNVKTSLVGWPTNPPGELPGGDDRRLPQCFFIPDRSYTMKELYFSRTLAVSTGVDKYLIAADSIEKIVCTDRIAITPPSQPGWP